MVLATAGKPLRNRPDVSLPYLCESGSHAASIPSVVPRHARDAGRCLSCDIVLRFGSDDASVLAEVSQLLDERWN